MTTLDYPVWLRVDHWLNVLLFVTLMHSQRHRDPRHPSQVVLE